MKHLFTFALAIPFSFRPQTGWKRLRWPAAVVAVWLATASAMAAPAFKLLLFTKCNGYEHPSIPSAVAAFQQLGINNNFQVAATNDAAAFTDANLSQYTAVVFLLTYGEVLDVNQRAAFTRYLRAGHGFMGVHSAADTEHAWPWFGGLLGARYVSLGEFQQATILTEDTADAATRFLPEGWLRTDEWYNFDVNPRINNVHVLCRLNETSYTGGTMGQDHPISWYRTYDGGRAWYTGLGHAPEHYAEPLFLRHLLGGIMYAAGVRAAPVEARWLFDGRCLASWRGINEQPPAWLLTNGNLQVVPGTGSIHTFPQFQDFRLHLEFLVPPNSSGNSGVFLQDQFETQILNSYGVAQPSATDCGAIYSIRRPDKNAALPPGVWQSYDIEFTAAQWQGATKLANARVSVWWNGELIHTNAEIPRMTASSSVDRPGPGPITLQDYGDPVQFRNIWIQPLTEVPHGEQVTLVRPGSTWRYLDTGTDLGSAWRANNYPDQTWPTGWAELGYGDGDEATVINQTNKAGAQIITSYFRKSFLAHEVWAFTNLNLLLLRDDGAIVYLNGKEVFRSNLPGSGVIASTPASSSIGGGLETTWLNTTLTTNALLEGTNMLAVELHQASSTTDASFDLALYGEKYAPPRLRSSLTGGQLTLTWPALPAGFRLESVPTLGVNQTWGSVTNSTILIPTVDASVTITNLNGDRFYHLKRD